MSAFIVLAAAPVIAVFLAVAVAAVLLVLWWGLRARMELCLLLPARADLPMGACPPSSPGTFITFGSWPGSGSGKKGWQ
jgi:hypothetical protein